MLYTAICFISIVIEIIISTLRSTPWAEILLWVAQRRRFPSGIWFEIISLRHQFEQSETRDTMNRVPKPVVSLLRSNYATLGKNPRVLLSN